MNVLMEIGKYMILLIFSSIIDDRKTIFHLILSFFYAGSNKIIRNSNNLKV